MALRDITCTFTVKSKTYQFCLRFSANFNFYGQKNHAKLQEFQQKYWSRLRFPPRSHLCRSFITNLFLRPPGGLLTLSGTPIAKTTDSPLDSSKNWP